MKVAIVDDIAEQLDYLVKQIEEVWKRRNPSGTFTAFSDVRELYPVVSEYDVIFMDIKMPEKDGITAAEELGVLAPRIITVFVSDYDSYVWNSFRAEPVYFLRKAFLIQELPLVVHKCIETYTRRNQTIVIDAMHEAYQCNIRDIYYIEAQRKFVSLHFAGSIKSMRTTFSRIEQSIQSPLFLKIHRSYLVNAAHIQSLQTRQVIMENGEVLPVSKYRYDTVHEQYVMSII